MDKIKALEIANDLRSYHGLTTWRVVFDRAVKRHGQCRHGRKEIGLSAKIVEISNMEQVIETTLHEIAHALVGA